MLVTELFGLIIVPSSAVPGYVLSDASVNADRIGGGGGDYDWTNETGQYVIDEDIVVGNYTVEASAEGYLDKKVNTTINSINDTKEVDIVLNRSAIITGKVVGASSDPVIGAEVTLYKNSTHPSYVDDTLTDWNGMYYFATDVDTGVYFVTVSFVFQSQYAAYPIVYGGNYTGLPWWSYVEAPYLDTGYVSGKSGYVSATAGSVVSAPDFVLDSSGVITGTVKNGRGDPMANAAVYAQNIDTYDSSAVLTDENGNYRIAYDITDGNYSLQAYSFGYISERVEIAATQSGTVVQNFTMISSATVHGHVYRNGDNRLVPGASVQLYGDGGLYMGYKTTDVDGYYSINTGLGPANYSVYVSLSYYPVNMTADIAISAGEDVTLDFWIDAYFIDGTIYENETGPARVSGAEVSLEFPDPPFPPGGSTYADDNGAYVMAVPILMGTNGTESNAILTVSAYDYNTTALNTNLTIGVDYTFDFILFKTPPIPPPPSATIMGTIYGIPGPALPSTYQWWHTTSGNYTYLVGVNASSGIEYVGGTVTAGYVYVHVWGPEGTSGQLTIWIPVDLYPGHFTITSSPGPDPSEVSQVNNGTYTIVTITYGHSSKYIYFQSDVVIPEFPSPLLFAAVLMAGTAFVVFEKKRRMRMPN